MRIFLLLLPFLLFPLLLGPAPAWAGGFVGPGSGETVRRASDVLSATDDTQCVLEGHIVAKVKNRKHRYLFEDGSGQVVVEIRRKAFGGATVTPQNRVRLEGEVNSSRKYPNEMDVEHLTVLD